MLRPQVPVVLSHFCLYTAPSLLEDTKVSETPGFIHTRSTLNFDQENTWLSSSGEHQRERSAGCYHSSSVGGSGPALNSHFLFSLTKSIPTLDTSVSPSSFSHFPDLKVYVLYLLSFILSSISVYSSVTVFVGPFLFIHSFIHLFIYFWLHWVFLAAWAFSSCSEWGLLFFAVCGLLIAVASLVVEHGL